MKSKKTAHQRKYQSITEDLQDYAEDEVNIRVRYTTTGPIVEFNITRDKKDFHRSKRVNALYEGRKLIDYYARLRDRFISFVDKGRVSTRSRPRTLREGLGDFGITGLYPQVRDGYVLVHIRFYPSRDQTVQRTVSGRNRTAQETAAKIADVLEGSVHPDHQHPRSFFIPRIAEKLIKFAKENNALLDAVPISRHTYKALYKRAGQPDDMPHPDNLDNVS